MAISAYVETRSGLLVARESTTVIVLNRKPSALARTACTPGGYSDRGFVFLSLPEIPVVREVVQFVCFPAPITERDVLSKISVEGLEPALPRVVLSLAATFPQDLRKMACLIPVSVREEKRYIFFSSRHSRRSCCLIDFRGHWPSMTQFPVVKKEEACLGVKNP